MIAQHTIIYLGPLTTASEALLNLLSLWSYRDKSVDTLLAENGAADHLVVLARDEGPNLQRHLYAVLYTLRQREKKHSTTMHRLTCCYQLISRNASWTCLKHLHQRP